MILYLEKNMNKFKVGDKVKRKDGNDFSSKKKIATVGEWGFNFEEKNRVSLVETGTYIAGSLIELVMSSPVRETTIVKKEIIPGVYGKVQVFGSGYVSTELLLTKDELAETIKTLQIIHDALE